MTIELAEKFNQYHAENPEIYQSFERFALYVIRQRARYGAKAIMERVRWHSMETGNDDFKINNNYTSYYVRLFEENHPEHADFFRKRKV